MVRPKRNGRTINHLALLLTACACFPSFQGFHFLFGSTGSLLGRGGTNIINEKSCWGWEKERTHFSPYHFGNRSGWWLIWWFARGRRVGLHRLPYLQLGLERCGAWEGEKWMRGTLQLKAYIPVAIAPEHVRAICPLLDPRLHAPKQPGSWGKISRWILIYKFNWVAYGLEARGIRFDRHGVPAKKIRQTETS